MLILIILVIRVNRIISQPELLIETEKMFLAIYTWSGSLNEKNGFFCRCTVAKLFPSCLLANFDSHYSGTWDLLIVRCGIQTEELHLYPASLTDELHKSFLGDLPFYSE